MSVPILQKSLPYDISTPRPLPGIAPLSPPDWLHIDEAHGAQMALRKSLIQERSKEVLAMQPRALEPAQELLDMVLDLHPNLSQAWGGYDPSGDTNPLKTIGELVQEDMCILEKIGDEHVMTGAVLCFPASWMLAEKIGAPLLGIHGTVPEYSSNIAARVQRLFDGVQAGRPLWRWNAIWNDDPALFQPRSISNPRPPADPKSAPFLRSERQCILRLPKTGAVVFSIHSYVLARADALTAQYSN